MRSGGLYWLACDLAEDADRLACQVLTGLPATSRAVLVCGGGSAAALAAPIPATAGPARLALYDHPTRSAARLLAAVRDDLPRVRTGKEAFWLLRLTVHHDSVPTANTLAMLCDALQQRLHKAGSTLLVISDEQASLLTEMLVLHNNRVSGLGQLFHSGLSTHLLQHFWCNHRGVFGPHDFLLAEDETGFSIRSLANADEAEAGANDQRLCLAMADLLEGSAAPSPEWELFDDIEALMERALSTRAATVLLPLDGNPAIDTLAARLYQLRKHCGRALKLVVCARQPNLRYQDELLLLASGANLIIPAGTPLLRLFTQLEAIQGQRWQRPLPDSPATTLRHLRPLDVRGCLSPRSFASATRQMMHTTEGRNVHHQLLHLPVLPGLTPQQVLSQAHLRRFGDIACVADGRLYLFLFACALPAIELALANIFRLPWKELVAGYETINDLTLLDTKAFQDDTPPEIGTEAFATTAGQSPVTTFTPITPTQRSLRQLEARP